MVKPGDGKSGQERGNAQGLSSLESNGGRMRVRAQQTSTEMRRTHRQRGGVGYAVARLSRTDG